MIHIKNKEQCCGCSACLHICPKHSISFKEDKEGFLYPEIDTKTCVNCGLCEKVCPVINQNDERQPLNVFAAKHPDDEIRMSSSSGGIFTLLAEQIIAEGGVVFGAKFNENWEVVHDFAETKEGLIPFRGSKYVQSRIGDAYVNAESFLKSGRKVMFTGTPCQIAGLKNYLRKEYENLLAVDFVCHGVPSPMVWRKYLNEEIARHDGAAKKWFLKSSQVSSTIAGINFRDKSTGWKNFSFALNFSEESAEGEVTSLLSSVYTENEYMKVFISNLSLRPSCYKCAVKCGKSESDITIGDFWGIDKLDYNFNSDKGISLILLNRPLTMLMTEQCTYSLQTYNNAIKYNPAIISSCHIHPLRGIFMKSCFVLGFYIAYWIIHSPNIICRVFRKIYRLI